MVVDPAVRPLFRVHSFLQLVYFVACLTALVSCSSNQQRAAEDTSDAGGPGTSADAGQSEAAASDGAVDDGQRPAPTFLLPRESIAASELGVLVNADDPQSVAVGAHYVKARGLPAQNLISVRLGASFATNKTTTVSAATFATWKTAIDAATPASIQAYAVTWIYPSVVDCMSLTSALAFGFDLKWCNSVAGCGATAPSPYFNSVSTTPFTTHAVRPAMVIAGTTEAAANALIDRGVSADATYPLSKGYLVRTNDAARSVRYSDFQATATAWNTPDSLVLEYVDNSVTGTGLISNKTDVLFYFTGFASVTDLATNAYLPGAMADHLTSYGGQIPESGQMSILRWIEAGATGSFGTVVEPCNYTTKFPQVSVALAEYFAGATLLEAYWKSVAWPGEGLFIGEPLARPYGTTSSFKDGTLTIVTTALIANKTYRVESAPAVGGPWAVALADIKVTAPSLKKIVVPGAVAPFYQLVMQ
jgi:uncharacterized protein (TIGR03790 family)